MPPKEPTKAEIEKRLRCRSSHLVQRRYPFRGNDPAQYRVGTIITTARFWSTSLLETSALGGAVGWVIKNSPGRYVGDSRRWRHEEEVIIPIGERLRIDKVYQKQVADDPVRRYVPDRILEDWMEIQANGQQRQLDQVNADDTLVFSFLQHCQRNKSDKVDQQHVIGDYVIVATGL